MERTSSLGDDYDSRDLGKIDSAGSRIALAFERCGKNRLDYSIAEVVCCFPGKQKELRQHEILSAASYCHKYLLNTINNKRYAKIICWGYIAHNSVVEIVKYIQKIDFRYCPSIIFAKHPTAKGVTQEDINKIVKNHL